MWGGSCLRGELRVIDWLIGWSLGVGCTRDGGRVVFAHQIRLAVSTINVVGLPVWAYTDLQVVGRVD